MTPDELKARRLFNECAGVWEPPPDLTVSGWADEFRIIPREASAEPGRWRTSRAEYQRAIMDALTDPLVNRVVMMTSAQIGKTEILLNAIGYFIDQEPSSILVLQPTIEMGQAFSKDRLAPMIRDTACLRDKVQAPRSKTTSNTLLHKAFPGGQVTIAGANSPVSLASRPIRILLCDEVDRYPASAGTEGDPLTLAAKRTANFWNRRILWVSTPTMAEASRIEKAFNTSSREEWCVPCPTCGTLTAFQWDNIVYKDKPEPVMRCPHCGAWHNEPEWKSGQQKGVWVAKNPSEKNIRGFHMTAFSSPWATWRELCDQYEEATRNSDNETMVWWNTVLGLPYEPKSGVIEVSTMESHRVKYPAELPDEVLLLTCGVDTQDDRLECEIVGWGVDKESWGIEYRIFYSDPGEKTVWDMLNDFLSKSWHYADGTERKLAATFIDSAGHHTDDVYKFCRGKTRRNIFACVGRGAPGLPSVGKPSRSNRLHLPLFSVGITGIKGDLFSRLRLTESGPGYCHFPDDPENKGHRGYDARYFKGLLSERMEVKRTSGRSILRWVPRYAGIRNEPLDVRVYATAAMELVWKPETIARLARERETRNDPVQVIATPARDREVARETPVPSPVRESRDAREVMEEKKVRPTAPRGIYVVSRGMSW